MPFRLLSCFIPFCLTLWHTNSSNFWRISDEAGLWAQWLQPSTWLQRLSLLLPFGDQAFRAHLPGAFLVAGAAWLVFHFTLQLLEQADRLESRVVTKPSSLHDQLLAALSAIAATCSLPWISEGAINLSSCLSATLVLATFYAAQKKSLALLSIALIGLSLEAPLLLCALCFLFIFTLKPSDYWSRIHGKIQFWVHGVSLCAMALISLLLGWKELSEWLFTEGQESQLPFKLWLNSPGVLWTTLGSIYIFWRIVKGSALSETFFCGALFLTLTDVLLPFAEPLSWLEATGISPSRNALHLAAIASFLPLSLTGLQLLESTASRLLFINRWPVGPLLLLIATSGTLASTEDTHQHLKHWDVLTSKRLIRSLLLDLPPHTLLIIDKSPLTQRLLAAHSSGVRPDLLMVPTHQLGNPNLAGKILGKEPALKTLVREYSIHGEPTEEALDLIADVRPLAVTPNAHWDKRLLEHLSPRSLLPIFSKHALGRSKRHAEIEKLELRLQPLLLETSMTVDRATRNVLKEEVAGLEACMLAISDRSAAAQLSDLLAESSESRAE